jgi:hypothetical protein
MARSSTTFGAGNQAGLKHGARSTIARKMVRDRVRTEMRALILAAVGEATPGDMFLVDLLQTALADVVQLREWCDERGGPVSKDGRPYKAMDMLQARERRAMELLDRLGLGARARAQIVGSLGAPRTNGLASQLHAERLGQLEAPARNGS